MWAFVCQTNLFKLQWLKQKNGATEKIEKTASQFRMRLLSRNSWKQDSSGI